ncbi:MAG TPA: hypothetical protein VF590_02385, partial [Isosphaeraceae bacterium]
MRPEPLTLPSPRGGEGAALRRRAIPGRLLPPLALGALTLVCFGRLVADPGALIVDARRPSVDAMGPPGVARPPGN